MKTIKRLSLSFTTLLGVLLFSNTAGAQSNLNQFFDAGICPGAPMTRQEAMGYLSVDTLERSLTSTKQGYVRTRRCYAEFGCREWYMEKMSDLTMLNYSTSISTARANSSPSRILSTGITLKYLSSHPIVLIGIWDSFTVEGSIINIATNLVTALDTYTNSTAEDVYFTANPQVPNFTSKLTTQCYWSKVTGSQEKIDSGSNPYRVDKEIVVYATF